MFASAAPSALPKDLDRSFSGSPRTALRGASRGSRPFACQAARAAFAVPEAEVSSFNNLDPAMPNVRVFPFRVWSNIYRRVWASPQPKLLTRKDPSGYRPLREAISTYLETVRGFRCTPDQVVVFHGTRQAMHITAQMLLDPGEAAWCENPGFIVGRLALTGAGARLVPVPVDAKGLVVSTGSERARDARLAIFSPSNQFPLGGTMHLSRRLELIEWAKEQKSWIFEDDYDSEFCFHSNPVAPIAALPHGGQVIYFGTFSKTLFPNARLSYVVASPDLAQEIARYRMRVEGLPSMQLQPVLAKFIEEGHLARHIKRCRDIYRTQLDGLYTYYRQHLSQWFRMTRPHAGLQAILYLSDALLERTTDMGFSGRLAEHNIFLKPLSRYYLSEQPRQGLVVGYYNINPDDLTSTLDHLRAIVGDVMTDSPERQLGPA